MIAPPSEDTFIGRVLDGRYEIGRRLGHGAMGAVYLARQRQLDRAVAVKVLKRDLPVDARARRRLHREARVIGRIHNPHVVQVHDYGQTPEGAPYLVMEYVRGEPPEVAISPRTDLGSIVAAILGVLEGLGAAHDRGVLHRDLKPANMIVRGSDPNAVVLLDFGIAAVLGSEDPSSTLSLELGPSEPDAQLTIDGTVMGTPLYMAPEQARSVQVSARADLYSAGVVLYQWLAGRTPFRGAVRQVMRAHVFDRVPPLEPRPGLVLADGLRDVLAVALEKNPEDRFSSAAEMAAAIRYATAASTPMRLPSLVVGSEDDSPDGPIAETTPLDRLSGVQGASGRVVAEPPFVGREAELSWLGRRLEEVAAGEGAIVLVEGPDGIGKTRLVREALDRQRAAGRIRLGRSAAPPGESPPLHLIRSATEDVLGGRSLSPEGLLIRLNQLTSSVPEGLSAAERGHLATWLRGGVATEASALVRPDTPLEWHEQALVERALRVIAASSTVVLWLDDLHWCDSATAAFLTRLAITLRLSPFPLMVVGSREVPTAPDPLDPLLRYLGSSVHRLALAPLSLGDTEQLLAGLMPLESSTTTQLAARADGSPLHAVQLVRHLTEVGLLEQRDDRWVLSDEPSGLVPASLEQMLSARLDGFLGRSSSGEPMARTMEAAAVLGPSFDVELLRRVLAASGADLGDEELDDLLDEGVDGGIFAEPGGSGDRLAWQHRMLRELTLSRMGRSRRRRRICRAAAEALIGEAGPSRDVARAVVELLLLAGDKHAAAEHAGVAGEQALAAGELADAVRLFSLGRTSESPSVRLAALWGLGNAENHLGHTALAEASYQSILGEEPDLRERGWAWFGVGRCRYNRGDPRGALDALERALGVFEEVGGAEGAVARSRVLRTLAATAAELPDVPVPEPDVESLLAEARDSGERSEHYTTLGYVALRRGDRTAAVRWLQDALREARVSGSSPALVNILCDLGRACRAAGELDAAGGYLREGLELARTIGQHSTEAEIHNELGELARARGELSAAANEYRAAVVLWRLLGSRHVLVGSLNQAIVAVEAGRPDEALDALNALDIEPSSGAWWAALLLTRGLARAASGDHLGAEADLEEGAALQLRYDPPHDEAIDVIGRLAAVWRAVGEVERAERAQEHASALQRTSIPSDE